jgi:hypothetical protein
MGSIDYPRVERLQDEAGVQISLDCYCHTCKLWHRPGPRTPEGFSLELWEWYAKHRGHDFEFLSPRRRLPRRFKDWFWQKMGCAPWYVEYGENTNFKLAYASAAALTITLASLATSATWVAGRESTVIDNRTTRNIDSEITAKITTGTTPTVDTEIRIYGYQALNPDTPTYPDTITGADAAVTLTSAYTRDGGIKPLLGATAVSATSNIGYPIACLSTAQAWGKEPARWGLYVTHSTVAALHATGGNHVLVRTSAYMTDT